MFFYQMQEQKYNHTEEKGADYQHVTRLNQNSALK